jgi:hypothetical protein
MVATAEQRKPAEIPKGYPLEHLIGNALDNGTTSMGKGLVQMLDTFLCRWADIYSQKVSLVCQITALTNMT